MTPALVQTIGTYIVSPIAASVMVIGVLYVLYKFTEDGK